MSATLESPVIFIENMGGDPLGRGSGPWTTIGTRVVNDDGNPISGLTVTAEDDRGNTYSLSKDGNWYSGGVPLGEITGSLSIEAYNSIGGFIYSNWREVYRTMHLGSAVRSRIIPDGFLSQDGNYAARVIAKLYDWEDPNWELESRSSTRINYPPRFWYSLIGPCRSGQKKNSIGSERTP